MENTTYTYKLELSMDEILDLEYALKTYYNKIYNLSQHHNNASKYTQHRIDEMKRIDKLIIKVLQTEPEKINHDVYG